MGEAPGKAGRGTAVEWPTVALVALVYLGWGGCGLWLWPVWPAAALVLMTLLVCLHGSLVHECLHGHPTRHPLINEALVFAPLGLIWPYRRFRALHLRHHATAHLTDPDADPESAYVHPDRYRDLPRWRRALLRVNATAAGRLALTPVLSAASLVAADARRVRRGEPGVARAWALHGAGCTPVLWAIHAGFGMPPWLYVLTVVWGAHSLMALRTFAEHRWHERPGARTIVVERTLMAPLFLNNNLHLVHHAHPGAPWYALPALYRARRSEWLAHNGGYVVAGYGDLLRRFAWRAREPVVHPAPRCAAVHRDA